MNEKRLTEMKRQQALRFAEAEDAARAIAQQRPETIDLVFTYEHPLWPKLRALVAAHGHDDIGLEQVTLRPYSTKASNAWRVETVGMRGGVEWYVDESEIDAVFA